VRGGGRMWIDGEDKGPAPGEFHVPFGRHVVWLTGPLRETGGKEVLVTAAQPGNATIMDGPLTRPQKVVRFRIALSQAQDPAARANAMKDLATFVNIHDAVLLTEVNGKIIWQTWRDRAPGFSALREYRNDGPLEILRQLAPVAPVDEPEPPSVYLPVVEQRWYQQPSVQLGSVATVMVAIVVGYFWAHYTERPRPWDTNITVPPAGK
jgi:hypothetical protein